ncbi:MAG: hypothetical protein V1650_03485 [Candidatus Omnitrophota bacterium]
MKKAKKIIASLIVFVFILQQTSFAQLSTQLNIGKYLNAMPSPAVDIFRPIHMRYFFYEPSSNQFKMLLDKGNQFDGNNVGAPLVGAPDSINDRAGTRPAPTSELEESAKTLLKYFLIGVTLPNDKFWVNLRPDASDQIIDPELAKTDVGKILLEADLQLKKDTARFTSPQTPEGKEYWDKLYKKVGELLGSDSIEIPTLTRPWIVPGEVIIRQTSNSAYVYKAGLKVMLEEDYLKRPQTVDQRPQTYNFTDPRLKELNKYSTELIKELILPKITQEVNTAKRYAQFRQVYYSLVLAQWFKKAYSGRERSRPFPTNFINRIDTQNLTGLTSKTSWSKETYFQEYQKSFKNGEYKLNETVSTLQGRVIRSYFSGGIVVETAVKNSDGLFGRSAQLPFVASLYGAPGFAGSAPSLELRPVTSPEQFREPVVSFSNSMRRYESGNAGHNSSKSASSPAPNDSVEKLSPSVVAKHLKVFFDQSRKEMATSLKHRAAVVVGCSDVDQMLRELRREIPEEVSQMEAIDLRRVKKNMPDIGLRIDQEQGDKKTMRVIPIIAPESEGDMASLLGYLRSRTLFEEDFWLRFVILVKDQKQYEELKRIMIKIQHSAYQFLIEGIGESGIFNLLETPAVSSGNDDFEIQVRSRTKAIPISGDFELKVTRRPGYDDFEIKAVPRSKDFELKVTPRAKVEPEFNDFELRVMPKWE